MIPDLLRLIHKDLFDTNNVDLSNILSIMGWNVTIVLFKKQKKCGDMGVNITLANQKNIKPLVFLEQKIDVHSNDPFIKPSRTKKKHNVIIC